MRISSCRAGLALAATLLTGCGQTGALYLPDEAIKTPVEIRTAPATPAPPVQPPAATPAAEEKPKEQAPKPPPPGT